MIEPLFNKVVGLENNNFIKNTLQRRYLSVIIAQLEKVDYFYFSLEISFLGKLVWKFKNCLFKVKFGT